ncbi:MAG: amidohydrolase family protein [Gammaproteobacteria bacterium]|nr:amidohydrolase family protein [Gammaproteobacteria bacterium]
MPLIRLTIILAVFFCAGAQAESTAFVNVNVIPMTESIVLTGRTVVVEGDRIVTIGDVNDTIIPDEAVVIDGTDRFLIPGLAEMHGHVPGASSNTLERVLHLYAVNGITTVRGMLGQPSHLQLRERLLANEMVGPRLITSGPSLNGNSVAGVKDGVEKVKSQHESGYDFLKIHPGLKLDEFNAIAGTAQDLEMPFAGHVPEDVGIHNALSAGIATIDHLDGYLQALVSPHDDTSGGLGGFFGLFIADQVDESGMQAIAQATRDAGVWNVPTQSLFEHVTSSMDPEEMRGWPEMKYMPPDTVERWVQYKKDLLNDANYTSAEAARAISLRRSLILALHDAGAGLLLGSDSPQIFNVPGFAIHRELEYLVASGLTPYQALRTGTVNPAVYFGHANVLGTVEPGMIADLVLLDANPLADIRNSRRVHGVMLRGRWLSRPVISAMLGQLEFD